VEQGVRLAQRLDEKLAELNVEYAAKRESLRLGAVRLELLPPGTWHDWDRKRLQQTGGTLEQYKHPCLIGDLQFRASIPVEQELAPTPTTATNRASRVSAV
jgi:hypothetical protein